jgi:RNA polymerase sigma-70 factor (ECF subfamily)
MSHDANRDRIDHLFDGWYSVLVNYAVRLTGSLDLAEDVVQETFYLLYRELAAGKAIANERAWTFCVVRREIGRQVYRHRTREVPLDSLELPSAATVHREPDEWSSLFSLLSPREEEVMLLTMEALKYREIGGMLGISPNSVATLHRRAIAKLRAAMGLQLKPAPSGGEAGLFRKHTATIKTSSI